VRGAGASAATLTALARDSRARDARLALVNDGADDDKARIAAAIAEAREYVGRMPPTAGMRELRSRLETFERVVRSWGAIHRPTTEQVDALIERVNEVRRLATSTAPTVRRRARPENE
jgi:streptomycin 6-kinase